MKVSLMREAHILAKSLSKFNDNSYRENFALSLKVRHIQKPGVGKNNIDQLNWIKNNMPAGFVNMSNIEDYGKDSRYTIKVDAYRDKVEIKQYLAVDQSYMNSII